MHPTDLYLERVESLLETKRFGRSVGRKLRVTTDLD